MSKPIIDWLIENHGLDYTLTEIRRYLVNTVHGLDHDYLLDVVSDLDVAIRRYRSRYDRR